MSDDYDRLLADKKALEAQLASLNLGLKTHASKLARTYLPPPRKGGREWPQWRTPMLWAFRVLILVPVIFMMPEYAAVLTGSNPHALANLSTSNADVLGTSIVLCFILMLSVTPFATLTGRREHVVLRRDLGIMMALLACIDLFTAAMVTGDSFHGGFLTRVVGHTFLAAGTLATLLVIPLMLTANRASQQWLGRHWKAVQRTTYAVWGLIILHLLLLFGFGDTFSGFGARPGVIRQTNFFYVILEMSVPLLLFRLGWFSKWWTKGCHCGTCRKLRWGLGIILVAMFLWGMESLLLEWGFKGIGAFSQTAPD